MTIGLSSSSDIHYFGPDPVHWINGQALIRSMRENENEEDDNDNDVAPNSPPRPRIIEIFLASPTNEVSILLLFRFNLHHVNFNCEPF